LIFEISQPGDWSGASNLRNIYGTSAADTSKAPASAERVNIYGGAGDDNLTGTTAGTNFFWGGSGINTLIGGSGTDIYRAKISSRATDIITSTSGAFDRIEIFLTNVGRFTFDGLNLIRDKNDLKGSVELASGDFYKFTIKNHYLKPEEGIDQIRIYSPADTRLSGNLDYGWSGFGLGLDTASTAHAEAGDSAANKFNPIFLTEKAFEGKETYRAFGNGGKDTLVRPGDDVKYVKFDGGVGDDTLEVAGVREDFTARVLSSNKNFALYKGQPSDGIFTELKDVEFIKFSDETVALSRLLIKNVVSGVTVSDGALYQTKAGTYVLDVAGKVADAPVTTYDQAAIELLQTAVKPWVNKGASIKAAILTDVDIQLILNAKTSWTEQKFDLDGLAKGGPSKLSLTQLYAKEATLNIDLNNDGKTGDVISVVYDAGESWSDKGLYKTVSGGFIIDAKGLAVDSRATQEATTLMASSKPFILKATTAKLIEYGDGHESGAAYGVVTGSGSNWILQRFKENGQVDKKAEKLSLSQLLETEVEVAKDLNRDTFYGNLITERLNDNNYIDAERALYKTTTGALMIDLIGFAKDASPNEEIYLRLNETKPWTLKKGTTVEGFIEIDDGLFEVVLKAGKNFTAQKFDAEGIVSGGALRLTAKTLEAREYFYNENFDGVGGVSLVGQSDPPVDWAM
jgi:hypothetical protein